MKRRKDKPALYLLSSDISELNSRYERLYLNIKNLEGKIPTAAIDRECEVLLEKYNFEIEQLSRMREAEYKVKEAEIREKNRRQIPWRRCWLWRLLFQPLTNRAQDIIEEKAIIDADEKFVAEESKLEVRTNKLYGENVYGSVNDTPEEPEPPEPPVRKSRNKPK